MRRRRLCVNLGMAVMSLAAAAWGQGSLIPPALYPVEGAPFTATIETLWDGTASKYPGRTLSLVMRDTAGRQRFDTPLVEEALGAGKTPSVVIYDVPGGKIIRLDVVRKVATVQPMTHVGRTVQIDTAARKGFPCHVGDNATELGVKTIAGLEACGQHIVQTMHRPDGDVTTERDLWLSTNYLMPLEQARVDAQLGNWSATVVKFDATEPDASLFVVPDGYEVRNIEAPTSVSLGRADSPAGISRIGGSVSAPVVLYAPEPEFSDAARRAGVDGNVLVYLQVNTQGLPINVRVLRGVGMGLDQKAMEAVKKYKFKPAMQDGHPVTVEMNVEVNFKIFKRIP